MINVLSLNNAHLGTTASELHAPLKTVSPQYQSIPSAAQQIFTVAQSGLKNDDSTVLGDGCTPPPPN